MDTNELRQIARRHLFRPSPTSYMSDLFETPILRKGKGTVVEDTDGKSYLDFASGQTCGVLGHAHPKIAAAIEEASRKLGHSSSIMLNEEIIRLADRLGEILPPPMEKMIFLVSGSDSIEAALDMARKFTGGYEVAGLHMGLHGSSNTMTRSLTFSWTRNRHHMAVPGTYALVAPYCYRCPLGRAFPECAYACLDVSFDLLDAQSCGALAAVIAEPIMSAGGVIDAPEGYFQELKKRCGERNMLLIFDESQTGLGKTGRMFAFEWEGVQPDIMVLSKHFGGGFPVSAAITSEEIEERAVANGFFATRSHAADPYAGAAGRASIEVLLEEDLVRKAHEIGTRLRRGFEELQKEFETVGDIRGRGLLQGVEFVKGRENKEPANAETRRMFDYCTEHGLLLQVRGSLRDRNVLRFVPPFTATPEEIDRALSILREALKSVAA